MINLSITGADNKVSVKELSAIAKENSNVEFGVLYLLERQGVNRNPDYAWRQDYFNAMPKEQTSLHLCAAQAFQDLLRDDFQFFKNDYGFNVFNELKQANRIQLNINSRHQIFSVEEIHKIYTRLLENGLRIIVQYNDNSKKWIDPYVLNSSFKDQIDILLDSSLGRGVVSETFELPEVFKGMSFKYGLAGGVNLENIERVKAQAKELMVPYWIDLESGSRTKNEFDMENKVKGLIKAMK